MRGLRMFPLLLVVLFASPGSGQVTPAGKDKEPKKEMSPSQIELDGRNLAAWVKELKNSDPSIREEAIRALMFYGKDASTKDIILLLLDRVLDKDVSPRLRALQALGGLEIPDEVLPLALKSIGFRLTDDPQGVVRAQASLLLCYLGKKAAPAIPALVKGTQDVTSWEIRRACAHALGQAGQTGSSTPPEPKAVAALIVCLKDPALQVRLTAIFSLGHLGAPGDPGQKALVESELTRLANDKDKSVSIWAWMTLMTVTGVNETAMKAIRQHLRHEDPRVRSAAARGLSQLGTAARFAAEDLAKLLKDKDPGVAAAAIHAISQIDDPGLEAMNGLKGLTEEKDAPEFLKKLAQAGIDHIKRVNKKDMPDKKP